MTAFPLLPRRRGDRTHTPPFSPAHDVLLEIPAARGGRVRLQLTMPWRHEQGSILLALEWPKAVDLPPVRCLGRTIWRVLCGRAGPPRRTKRFGLSAFPVSVAAWSGRLYVPTAHLGTVRRLDPANAVTGLTAGLDHASRMLVGRWESRVDPQAWIYAMHFRLALLVADEVAREYLDGLPSVPLPLQRLHQAIPQLRRCVNAAYPGQSPRQLTPHRLAMAIVDAKLSHLLRPLLDPGGRAGLDDGTLWRRALPLATERRLCALRKRDWYVANWCKRWRSLMLTVPLDSYCFFQVRGDEDLAARIRRALHS